MDRQRPCVKAITKLWLCVWHFFLDKANVSFLRQSRLLMRCIKHCLNSLSIICREKKRKLTFCYLVLHIKGPKALNILVVALPSKQDCVGIMCSIKSARMTKRKSLFLFLWQSFVPRYANLKVTSAESILPSHKKGQLWLVLPVWGSFLSKNHYLSLELRNTCRSFTAQNQFSPAFSPPYLNLDAKHLTWKDNEWLQFKNSWERLGSKLKTNFLKASPATHTNKYGLGQKFIL